MHQVSYNVYVPKQTNIQIHQRQQQPTQYQFVGPYILDKTLGRGQTGKIWN
jgi:hypothetical protein